MSKRKIKSVTGFGTLECWNHFSSFNLFFRFHPFSSIMQHPSQQIGGISDISKYPHLRQLWPSHNANNLLPGSFQVFWVFCLQVFQVICFSIPSIHSPHLRQLWPPTMQTTCRQDLGVHEYLTGKFFLAWQKYIDNQSLGEGYIASVKTPRHA